MTRRATDLLRASYAERKTVEAIARAEAEPGDPALADHVVGYRADPDGSIRAILKRKARDARARANARRRKDAREAYDERLVLSRLVEALRILRRVRDKRIGSYGNPHPDVLKSAQDLWLEQLYRMELDEEMEERERERLNRRSLPTAIEVQRMEEALAWPIRFLAAYPLACAVIWANAYERAFPRGTKAERGGDDSLTPGERALLRLLQRRCDADDLGIPPSQRSELIRAISSRTSPKVRAFLRTTYRRGLAAIVQGLNPV